MTTNGSHSPPATGARILESVQSLHEAVGLLGEQNKLLQPAIVHLTEESTRLAWSASEQEHTRRVLLFMSRGAGALR
jgi:hypothetical protein